MADRIDELRWRARCNHGQYGWAFNCEQATELLELGEALRDALDRLLTALGMEPMDVAAIYGPDACADDIINEASIQAQAALAKLEPLSSLECNTGDGDG